MRQPRFLDRMSHPHLVTLVMASAFGPVAMNLFLPSLPSIALYFGTDYSVAQLAVPLYFTATALLQLIIGPLSDRYGRRPILVVCIALALLATLVGIYATTVEVFLIARLFQGTAVAGMVISRAAIRDMVDTNEAASRIGYVTMAMTLAPMIGPVIGGYFAEIFGWQATFWVIFLFGLAAFVLVWSDMGETIHSFGTSIASQLQAYPELLRSRRFMGYAVTGALSAGSFYSFLGGSPYLASHYYGLSESVSGYYFTLVAGGYLVGNYLSGRYSRQVGINSMAVAGGAISSVGMMLALVLSLAGIDHPIAFYGPVFAIGVGNGVTLPNANAGIVSVRPRLAGSASGLGGFLQIGGGAILSVLAGYLVGPGTGPMPLIILMLVPSLLSIVTALYVVAVAKSLARAEEAGQTTSQ